MEDDGSELTATTELQTDRGSINRTVMEVKGWARHQLKGWRGWRV